MYLNKKKVFVPVLLASSVFTIVAVFAAAMFDPDIQPIGYVGQPVASNLSVVSGNETLYAADYNSVDWSGNLHSYNLASNGAIGTIDNWDGGAAEQIDGQHFDTGRHIVTWNGTTGVAFRWSGTSSLTDAQKTSLDNATVALSASATSSPVLDYIRGDVSQQANQATPGPYRARSSVLGDIIHSTPVYWNDGTNRTVFVGANDGMLHAINANDGTERFAYIPSMLIHRLSELKNPAYTHRYFVDGRMDIRKFGTQTILAGALGAGGKGLFGLDVTSAAVSSESGAASKILWEISNTTANYANLGYTYGAPSLLVLPDGTKAVAVGNGYNNSGNGHASLFLINAATGTLIKEIDTTPSAGNDSSPNGLSTPSFLDTNGDGKKDIAYAGDIDGNLWKFNLASPYAVTKLHTTNPAKAITTAPSIIKHPSGGNMVTFVTGRMLIDNDATDNDKHAAYGIWDGAPGTNTTLLAQTLTEASYTAATPSVRVRTATSNAPDWAVHKGWRTELPIGGERLVGDGAMVKDGAPPIFLFMTSNPTIAAATGTALDAVVPPGSNWLMQLSALTGGDSNSVQFDLNKDGTFTVADAVGDTTPKHPVGRHMGAGVRSQLIALSAKSNYVYQANYDKNGSAPPVTVGADPGVAGGHFDEDIYYGSSLTASQPSSKLHVHEYDDKFDVTGVNMLNASNPGFNLINAIPLATTQFKVLAQNQYLNPAVKIHLHGSPSYVFNIDQGYTPIKNFITSATLDVTDDTKVPTYNRSDILSLAINMPVDSFKIKDWWGGAPGGASGLPLPADLRVGLHPTQTGCVKSAKGSTDGNMYQPVNPPTDVTATGNGTLGYSSSTTAITATGVRHNGALVIQVIKAATPNSVIEMSVPNRPEYGWRVKSAEVKNWVLAEYTTFWHEKVNGKCYGEAGWTKAPVADARVCGASNTTTSKRCGTIEASTRGNDPHIGGLGNVVTYTQGNVTTTTTRNADGTITIVTVVTNADGTTTTTTRTISQGIDTGGTVNASGEVDHKGESSSAPSLGRINWRELLQ